MDQTSVRYIGLVGSSQFIGAIEESLVRCANLRMKYGELTQIINRVNSRFLKGYTGTIIWIEQLYFIIAQEITTC